jgi:hypothetical protein
MTALKPLFQRSALQFPLYRVANWRPFFLGIMPTSQLVFVLKDSRGAKKRNVGKCLWKISQLSFFTRIVLLGEKSQVVSHIEQALEQFARFFLSTE